MTETHNAIAGVPPYERGFHAMGYLKEVPPVLPMEQGIHFCSCYTHIHCLSPYKYFAMKVEVLPLPLQKKQVHVPDLVHDRDPVPAELFYSLYSLSV